MTRKDYVAIAAALNGGSIVGAPQTCGSADDFMRGAREQAANYIYRIADVMAQDNPRFDRARFLQACGVQS